ncbi:MAG: tetratricopeptide repeat protein, partial [Planctomycetota bacterium]
MSRQAKLLLVIGSVAYFVGCSSEGNRKIKLSSNSDNPTGVQTASSVLQVGPEDQRNIAILFFENETGDANLDWLRRGLTEMLTTDLTQSRDLNVVTVQRLQELLARQVEEVPNNIDVSLAIKVARDAEIESILTGRIYTEGSELFIEVELRDARTGKLLRRESVNSPGMEQIFSMVNDLSRRVRTSLRGDLVAETEREFQLTDMTKSLEAYRCYSQALENSEKFLLAEAEKCLKDAIKSDSTFAAAYLQLAILKFKQHNVEEAMQSMEKARLYAHKLSEVDQIRLKLMESKHGNDVESYLAALEEFLSYTPYDSETRMQLAGTYLELKQYDKALEEYEAVLELDPKRKLAHNQLGYVYAYRGDFATALKHIDKYAEASP